MHLVQLNFSNVCPRLIFTTHKMEIMVPPSSVEVSGVLGEAVIIFQEHFQLLLLSSGNKLYFLMVGVKDLCRNKSAFLKFSTLPLCWVLHFMHLYAQKGTRNNRKIVSS